HAPPAFARDALRAPGATVPQPPSQAPAGAHYELGHGVVIRDAFAERNVMESLPDLRPRLHPCGLTLAARITLRHFSVSSAISLPKSAGESASTSPPRSTMRAFIRGSARAALI